MDFSREGVIQKQKSIRSTMKRLNSKLWVTVFRLCIIALVSVAIFCTMAGLGALNALIDTVPDVEMDKLESTGYRSTAFYSDGTVAQTFAGIEANRKDVSIEDIPLVVQHCFVALEDERFYQHNGIDVRGIFRAGYSILKDSDGLGYGASTITQQLLKNRVFGGGLETNDLDKIIRKIQEQYLAIQLENVLTKDEILEFYLNYINLGNGAYGIQTAAQSYFGKDVGQLTLSEASVLAPIALSPTNRNPITHPDKNAERRKACLDNMLKLNFCTKEEYDAALNDDIYSRVASFSVKKTTTVNSTYSYFTDEVLEQVTNDLVNKLGYTNEQARNLIYYSGINIYTTQDREIQNIVDSYYQDESNFPEFGFTSSTGSCYELSYALSVYKSDESVIHYQRDDFINYFADYSDVDGLYYHKDGGHKGISELLLDPDDVNAKIEEFVEAMVGEGDTYKESKTITPQPQSSFSLIEQSTGKVVALYGGRGKKEGSLTLNRATNTLRQVGSTFKVLASFLPAIDAAGLTLATVQDDCKYLYPGTEKEVINWYTTGFRGIQTIRSGISSSLNIVAVKTLQQIGASLGFEYLEKLGFSSLVKSKTDVDGTVYSDINLSIALGGLTYGVTNAELTAAYAAIANGGVYNKPIYYTKILDKNGKVILSNESEPTQVMKTSSAWLLTSAMLDTVTSGTGSRLAFQEYDMPVAGKTGTATNNNDLWFAGYTPYYTASIWTGYDNNFNQKNKSYQQDLWRNIMEDIHAKRNLPYTTFEMPDSIVKANICTKCGNLAVTGLCDEAEGGSCAKIEYFAKGTVPTSKCTCHVKVSMCKTSHKLATENCPERRKKTVVLLVKDENYEEETWDTPYIYHPEETCDRHLGTGLPDDLNDTNPLLPSDEIPEIDSDTEDDYTTDEEIPDNNQHPYPEEDDTYPDDDERIPEG